MTDRHAAYIVTLSEDIREDDAEATITALSMVRGVASVTPVLSDYGQAIARERRDAEWMTALAKLARNGPEGSKP